MIVRLLSTAIVAGFLSTTGAFAQSITDVGGPAEQPPAGYTGQQYVDSRGCVFVRAGLAGRTNWVPRIDRNRDVICGRTPSLARRAAPEAEPAPVVAATPAPAPGPAPMATVASDMMPEAAPRRVVRAAPPVAAPAPAAATVVRTAPQYTVVQGAGSTGRKIGCYENTPVPVRVALTNGGTAVLCTRGDGTLEGARAPIYPPGSGVGASLDGPGEHGAPAPAPVVRRTVAAAPAIEPPPGYRTAWEDGRLNPRRGPRTAEGQAQQDRVWTREVPATAVAEVAAPQATVSSKSEPQQGSGSLYVQVGSFGVAQNAQNARATLRGLGLPTARAESGGLTIVLAGPFGSGADAQAALGAARGAGFGDAFIR
jgi:hypothetical protein